MTEPAVGVPTKDTGGVGPGATPSDGTPSGTTPADGVRVELPTRRQLRLQLRDGKAVAPSTEDAVRPELGEPIPGGRRDLRRQYTSQLSTVDGGARDDAAAPVPAQGWVPPPTRPGEMSVAEALAARNATPAQQTPVEKVPDGAGVPKPPAPRASPPVPAAAKPAPMDPASPENLAFLVRLVLMPAPGAAPAAVPVPAIFAVPIVLRRLEDTEAGAEADSDVGEDADVGPSVVAPDTSAPVQARTAFGLDPLDVMTAGLRRTRRARYIQYSMAGVGAATLITGIMMIVSSLQG